MSIDLHRSKYILPEKTLEEPSSTRFLLQEATLAEIFTARRLARQVPMAHTLEMDMKLENVNIYGYSTTVLDVTVFSGNLWLLTVGFGF